MSRQPALTGPRPVPRANEPWTSYKERIRRLSDRLVQAQRPIRVLDALKWDERTEAEFFAGRFRELPVVTDEYYARERPLPFEPSDKLTELEALARDIERSVGRDDPLGKILLRNCKQYQGVVHMLGARGTREFHRWSKQMYGSPKDTFLDGTTTVRELGELLYGILSGLREEDLGPAKPGDIPAEKVVEDLNLRFRRYFADTEVGVLLDDGIMSDAAAGADYVKIKRGATFSTREVDILEVHEGWVHVGTTVNGNRQPVATWLSKGPPCTIAIQEGLATLVEVITFVSTPARARRLNNRVLACDKAEDGATFLDVFEFYRTEGYGERECFQHAQRVFRGGVIAGGAPFTKDISYCRGFVMIYNFLRTAIRFGRPEVIPFLFVGKVDLDDVPVLAEQHRAGVIERPLYLPPQFSDLNGLAMWLGYSNFFNRVNLEKVQEYYSPHLADGPRGRTMADSAK